MNKTTITLTILYLLIIIYFMIFNWGIFLLVLDVNLGIAVIQVPLIAGIFLVGFLLYIFLLISNFFSTIFLKKKLDKTESELLKIKANQTVIQEDKLDQFSIKLDKMMERFESHLKQENKQ